LPADLWEAAPCRAERRVVRSAGGSAVLRLAVVGRVSGDACRPFGRRGQAVGPGAVHGAARRRDVGPVRARHHCDGDARLDAPRGLQLSSMILALSHPAHDAAGASATLWMRWTFDPPVVTWLVLIAVVYIAGVS